MKNKIFGTWLRELCSLVFVQSMQAILITIMLSIIVKLYVNMGDNVPASQSLGIYCIFILAIVPKVELLVKKIFGLGSGVMDDSMRGAKNSLLKAGVAFGLGKRVLDNGGKMVGGAIGLASGGKKTRIAENNMRVAENQKKRNDLLNKNPNLLGTSGSSENGGGSYNFGLGDLTNAIRNANAKDPEEAFAEAKHEQRQKRLESLKKMTSGVTETMGALGGAGLGAVVSLGTGGDDLFEEMAIGAGLGDSAGKAVANATVGNAQKFSDWNYDRKVTNNKLAESKLKRQNAEKEYEDLVKQVNSKPNKTSTVRRASDLDADIKKHYDNAIKAKKSGDMEKYKQERGMAAGMMKANKTSAHRAINDTKKSLGNSQGISKNKSSDKTIGQKLNDIDNI